MNKMKKALCLLCAAAMVFTLAACGGDKGSDGTYNPGTYTGEAQGYAGTVTAEITVDANSITSVKLTGNDETPGVGQAALPELEEQVKTAQGADIDGVTGATGTSNGAKEAVKAALEQAKK